MKLSLLLALLFPIIVLASEKQPSLRIETIHPDGTKTVKKMVTSKPKQTVTGSPYKALQAPFLAEKQRNLALILSLVRKNFKPYYPLSVPVTRQCKIMANYDIHGNLTDSVVFRDGEYSICESARYAISQSAIVPMSSNPQVYDSVRNITFTFTQPKR